MLAPRTRTPTHAHARAAHTHAHARTHTRAHTHAHTSHIHDIPLFSLLSPFPFSRQSDHIPVRDTSVTPTLKQTTKQTNKSSVLHEEGSCPSTTFLLHRGMVRCCFFAFWRSCCSVFATSDSTDHATLWPFPTCFSNCNDSHQRLFAWVSPHFFGQSRAWL